MLVRLMNGVDLTNQYRAEYETLRTVFRNRLSISDIAIVNAFCIHCIYKRQQGTISMSQLAFVRSFIRTELFAFASLTKRRELTVT